ncbi:zinc finger protein 644 [Aplochiton taeniatus]
MMYHLDEHNPGHPENVPVQRPFICRECGRSFRDGNSLVRHIIIHGERRQRLMEEIKELHKVEDEGREARLQCSRCVFGSNSNKTFVQHTKVHESEEGRCGGEECGGVTLTKQEAGLRMKQSDTSEAPPLKRAVGPRPSSLAPSLWTPDEERKLALKPKGSIDVTTGLPYGEADIQEDIAFSAASDKHTSYPSNVDFWLASKTAVKTDSFSCHSYDSDDSRENRRDVVGRGPEAQTVTPKSLSKRKMSTPLRSTVNGMNCIVLTTVNQRLKETSSPEVSEKEGDEGDSDDFSDYTSEATANFLDCSVNENNPYARSYFIRKQRGPKVKEEPAPVSDQPVGNSDGEDGVDDGEIRQLIIKEEYIESAVCDDLPESPSPEPRSGGPSDHAPSSGATEHPKPCPYCPAMFDSGVGLSNHVRGHLHRVGLRYDARHMVSPEQIALQDCHQRVRRKIPAGTRRSKKDKPQESRGEHTCPLCWGWFDTKTGLSNHVRGHLKRIGKNVPPGSSKSPVCILNELLRDEKEHQNILQILNGKPAFPRPFAPQKFHAKRGLFLAATGSPHEIDEHGGDIEGTDPWTFKDSSVPGPEEGKTFISEREKGLSQTQIAAFSTMVSSSTLVRLLKEREMERQLDRKASVYESYSKHFAKESGVEVATGVESNWARVHNGRSNGKVCVHCNTIFPSAVSLSNHLRAYERRKQLASLEGASYDCKQKKVRPRPGLKRKGFPLSTTAEEIYNLTCRFCDLVFQGPLSVQEDWIKHLQRHIMHNRVAATGTGMVEVLGALQPKVDPLSQDEHTNLDVKRHSSPPDLPVAS